MVILVALAACGQTRETGYDDHILGAKIYNHDGNLDSLITEWKELGFNSAFMSPDLAARESFSKRVNAAGMKSFVILPIFFNSDVLALNPDWYSITNLGEKAKDEWVEFICPSRRDYLDLQIEYIRNVITEVEPTGISLDFIRFFAFWEKIYPDRSPESIPTACFDSLCLSGFQQHAGVVIPDHLTSVEEKASWILDNNSESWTQWKSSQIVDVVRQIVTEAKLIDPQILVNLHAVPWRESDFDDAITRVTGQDFRRLEAFTDYISPMCYSHMVKRKPAWVNEVVTDIHGQIHSSKVLPSIQVSQAYLEDSIDTTEFRATLKSALKEPSSGVIFWSWEALTKSPEKKEIVATILKGT